MDPMYLWQVHVNFARVTEVGAGYLADALKMNNLIDKLTVESDGIATEGSRLTKDHGGY